MQRNMQGIADYCNMKRSMQIVDNYDMSRNMKRNMYVEQKSMQRGMTDIAVCRVGTIWATAYSG